ncbi:tetratricopeptide repeat protein [Hymenobacter taeanensis]|uniref:Tetratricopeptide repeat protein n=1 Tax=Hymenobacter taeanensis TaxID=2735321 RepID=A0A6M6BHP3_9BACT|nr:MULTISPECIES: tetratricopeptide repeat protein [Hymenobacter]QJX46565.1 tetratricopeptide repeat protein [Hymenobacter taeanensis]UOQ80423.1 tetratricopeptide repeat protein [Hymenobacter sp. 5414T-23]
MSTLDDLFARLREASTPTEIEALQDGIWQIWLMTGHPLLDKYLESGMRAMAAGDYTLAIREFSFLIDASPDYAEGWNKRATAHYLRGEYRASLDDARQTLRLEPRHFGALSGRATMLLHLGDVAGSLRALQRLEHLCPNWPGLQTRLRDLRDQLDEPGL